MFSMEPPHLGTCHLHVPGKSTWPRGLTTFFMLNSAEIEIHPANKC